MLLNDCVLTAEFERDGKMITNDEWVITGKETSWPTVIYRILARSVFHISVVANVPFTRTHNCLKVFRFIFIQLA